VKLLLENWRQYLNEHASVPDANVALFIKPSDIHGKGIFAGEYIPEGTQIGITAIRNGGDNWVLPTLGRWHNHSEEPTCYSVISAPIEGEKYTRTMIAGRNILPGEEITVDYREQPEMEQPGNWAIQS
tara:strand:- start:164 stop:547 length:384 start_codon:yes stop_codon:yes gene_type:complete